jgi:hypothetical protein
MGWSQWKGALVLSLACASVGWGQQPAAAPPTAGQAAQRFMTVREMGKPALRCLVVRSWTLDGGRQAHDVQAQETGEMITIVDGTPAGQVQPGAPRTMRTIHWGASKTRPANAPAPPGDGVRIATSSTPSQPVLVPAILPTVPSQPMSKPGSSVVTSSAPASSIPARAGIGSGAVSTTSAPASSIPARAVASSSSQSPYTASTKQSAAPVRQVSANHKEVSSPTLATPPAITGSTKVPVVERSEKAKPEATGSVIGECPGKEMLYKTGDVKTVQEVGKKARECLVIRCWKMDNGCQACEMQALDTGEMFTIVECGAALAVPGAQPGGTVKAVAARIFPWGRSRMSPAGVPVPPPIVVQETLVPSPGPVAVEQPQKPRLMDRIQALFSKGSNNTQVVKTTPADKTSKPVQTVKAPVETPQPTDHRKSWGDSTEAKAPSTPVSQNETQKRPDPILMPETYAPRTVEEKIPGYKEMVAQANRDGKPQSPAAPTTSPLETVAVLPGDGAMPLGARSVLEASNGLNSGPVRYIPVPVVTVPEPKRPPLPPVPKMPEAPQLNVYVNAFTPPDATAVAQRMPPVNAFTSGGMPPEQMSMGMAPGNPPHPGMMPAQARMPQGYPPMPPSPYQGMIPPPGMMPVNYLPGQVNMPRNYSGPMPPDPFRSNPMPPQMPGAMPMPTSHVNPAMDRRMPAMQMTADEAAMMQAIQEMLAVMQTSIYPSQREWAANNLATFDAKAYPIVVETLTTAARSDPAGTVRAACIYGLSRMKVDTAAVRITLEQLKADRDPRVRQEAEQAIARMAPATSPATELPNVQPAGGVNKQ